MSASILFTIWLYALAGQARQVDSPPTPASIAEAEAEGAAFPREAPPALLPPGFRPNEVQGTGERRCVAFPDGAVLSHIRTSHLKFGSE
jgi:hypothetical protein